MSNVVLQHQRSGLLSDFPYADLSIFNSLLLLQQKDITVGCQTDMYISPGYI